MATSEIDEFDITFSIASKLEHVWVLRASIGGILTQAEVAEEDIFLLQLAVSEVVNNSIEHGYRGKTDGCIDVSMKRNCSELRIDIEDNATPLPVERLKEMIRYQASEIEANRNWPSRGHGLQIVLGAINSLDVARVAGRNRVTLRKTITPVSRSAAT